MRRDVIVRVAETRPESNAIAKCLLAIRPSSKSRIRLEALYLVWSASLGEAIWQMPSRLKV